MGMAWINQVNSDQNAPGRVLDKGLILSMARRIVATPLGETLDNLRQAFLFAVRIDLR